SGAAKSYGVEAFSDSDDLVQNNICQHVVACLMVGQDYGSVYAYNYMVDSGYSPTDWMIGMIFENHDFSGMDLFEGNDADGINLDNVHGTGSTETAFRNRYRGQDTPEKTNSLLVVQDSAFNRAENFVGNVFGTSGSETAYQTTIAFNSGNIWDLNNQAEHGSVPNDPIVASSLLRWGNYDVVTGAVRWCGNSADPGWSTTCSSMSEIPTTGVTFISGNAVPSNTALPASFYLSSQPAFWATSFGTPPWPAIGPGVSGGTAPDGVAGYSYSIPSQLCAANTPVDPAYQQTFTVTAASWSAGTVTLTIGSNALASSNTVTVSGISPAAYNGIFAVTGETATTITYALASNPGTYTSGGTVAYPNILLFNAANCYPAAYGALPSPPSSLSAVVQ
ncbi:MAG: hypothetical protein ACRD18_12910, partial [Terriglobia bacterium]